ncbi:MAG: GNAT family N-acetyltransferase [Acidimicrobiales bacterium]
MESVTPAGPMIVRRITPTDARELKAIRLAALADSPSAFGSTLEREEAFPDAEWTTRARVAADSELQSTFFALDGDAFVGLAGGYCDAGAEPIELVSMWIAPTHRRAGLGRALVQAVLDWATEVGAQSVSLWVTRGNDRAEALYASMGFTVTGDFQPLPSDPCKDEIRMERRLR